MGEAAWPAAVAVATGLLTCLATRVLIPVLAHRGILDRPNERSSHRVPTPRGGGIAVIGDPALYACAGDARIADVVVRDAGELAVTVLGAGERVGLYFASANFDEATFDEPARFVAADLAVEDEDDAGYCQKDLVCGDPPQHDGCP